LKFNICIDPLKLPRICGRPQCEPVSSKFNFKQTAYNYDYNVHLRTEFFGTGRNTSDLYLTANIDMLFPKPCEGFLRINKVQMRDKLYNATKDESVENDYNNIYSYDYDTANTSSDEAVDNEDLHRHSKLLEEDLKKDLLRFAFHDGHIGEVCPSLNETAWVLNFKKGILSAFQNTMMRFDVDFNTTEIDVSGECNVQYTLEDARNVFIAVKKVKDISSCRKRYATESILQTTPYTFRDDTTIWPILNSESYCNVSSL